MKEEKGQIIKAKVGNTAMEIELPKAFMRRHGNEKPHIHHSKPHPSANDKVCDVCGKMMVKHYHVCEACWQYLKESVITQIRSIESRLTELEKKKAQA